MSDVGAGRRAATSPPVVAVDGLAAGYGGPPVLTDVSFQAQAGQRVAVLGPNGGGKSTLFRVLLGELAPLRGSAEVHGRRGTVPQTERSRLDYPVSALDVALMGSLSRLPWWRRPGRAERGRALDALRVVGLADLAGETFGELSGGQRQRVLVARALVQDAALLLLDEPYSGVDEPTARQLTELFDRLAGEGRTLLMATHDMEQARAWDLVLCLNRRQVAFGPPDAVLTRPVLEATYGDAIVALPGDAGGGVKAVIPPHHHHHGPEEPDPSGLAGSPSDRRTP
jgi:ABC-type Mn2+/Zn2+ transport system ATPase subunit